MTVNRTHDDQNRLITNGATTITYDKNGNMTLGGGVTGRLNRAACRSG